jgi:hypothetical protein
MGDVTSRPLAPRVRDYVARGYSNRQIRAELPDIDYHCLAATISQARKHLGIKPPPSTAADGLMPIPPQALRRAFDDAAISRGDFRPDAGERLMLRALGLIVRDNLLDAVLDDGAVSGATAPQGQGVSSRPPADRPSVPAAPHGAWSSESGVRS